MAGPKHANEPTRWAELDLRSLALFRVVLGSFVLLDVLLRLADLSAFYSDDGVLPRAALAGSNFANYWFSLHMGTGSSFGQLILFAITAAFALGLILGWRTPWMVAGCWLMVNSMHARNPFVNDRGDLQLVLMLFWGFFLPLGACLSKDAVAGRKPWGRSTGLAPAALILQFTYIYLFTAMLKTGDFWLARGDGLKHSLESPLFATDLAGWLAVAAEPLLRTGNYGVVAGELFVGMLLVTPFMVSTLRSTAVVLLMTFHLAVAFLFELGLFPFIGLLMPVALIPKEFWSGFGARLAARLGLSEPVGDKPADRWTRPIAVFVGLCAVLGLLSNLAYRVKGPAFARPAPVLYLTEALRLEQHWDLFSPIPPYHGTFRLSNQHKVLFQGPPTQERPDLQTFPNHRWRMLMLTTLYPSLGVTREGVARVLATQAGYPVGPGAKGLNYTFRVRLVDKKGQLQDPITWTLWP